MPQSNRSRPWQDLRHQRPSGVIPLPSSNDFGPGIDYILEKRGNSARTQIDVKLVEMGYATATIQEMWNGIEEGDADAAPEATGPDPQFDAARRLHRLALEYAKRAHAAEAELVRAFEAEASALAHEVGEVLIEDDDDERLALTARGRFAGQAFTDDPVPGWHAVSSPDDVAERYEPGDLFTDLANAIAERFQGVSDPEELVDAPTEPHFSTGEEVVPTGALGDAALPPSPTDAWDEPTAAEDLPKAHGTATLRALESLHAAGVLTDAQFDAKKAELGQPT
jgi:hypothetical protein